MNLIVGLTGGIGSGKSRVGEIFSQFGVPVVDADRLAREAVAPGSDGLQLVVARFGREVLLDDGTLNRRLLRERIFRDPKARDALEAIIHPIVRNRIDEWTLAQKTPYVVHMVPLLLEKGLERTVDRVLVVDAMPEQQILRVMARDGVAEQEVRSVLATQIDRKVRLLKADDVLDNRLGEEKLKISVRSLHEKYLLMGEARQG